MNGYTTTEGFNTQKLPELKAWRESDIVRLEFGYELVEAAGEDVEPAIKYESVDIQGDFTYGKAVSEIIRAKYSADETEAITANYIKTATQGEELDEEKREEYIAEYQAYQDRRAYAKEIAQKAVELIQ